MMSIVNVFLIILLVGGSNQQEVDSGSDIATTMGKDFFFGIPLFPGSLSSEIVLNVGTSSETATYNIETLSVGLFGRRVTSDAPHRIRLNAFEVTSSGFQNRLKGIHVSATGENSIYVVVTLSFPRFFPYGYASFPIYPSYNFSRNDAYEYYALSTDSVSSFSNILLVGNYDNTTISVTPTQNVSLPANTQINSSLVEVTAGSTHVITLGRLQTLLIFSDRDLTGTRIVSDMPVSVISGHQCANVPRTASFCEPLYVHLPPTINWGQFFMLAPFAGRSSQIYKLVTSMASTEVSYRCGTSEGKGAIVSAAGSGMSIVPQPNSTCYLTASKPIYLVQFATGYSVDGAGDPAVAAVAPTSGYVKQVSFVTLPLVSTFVTVIVQTKHFNRSHILIDGVGLMCEPGWTDILDIVNDTVVGHVCTQSISMGPHSITHMGDSGSFSAVAYGWDSNPARGYAYLTGLNLEVTETTTDVPDLNLERDLQYFDLSDLREVKVLPPEEESNSGPIVIPGSLLFGEDLVTTVYVNENGVFSFGEPWKFSHPNRFPTENHYTKQKNVVAPFWSDNDIRKEGTIRYAAIERGSPQSDSIMNETAVYINDHFILDGERPFEPTWVLVAQWERVHPYPHGANDHEGIDEEYLSKINTYQGVIATDRIQSYYIFSFACGEIEWSGQGSETSIIGYNSRGYGFKNHPTNGFPDIGQVVSCTRNIQSAKRKKRDTTNSVGLTFSDLDGILPGAQAIRDAICACEVLASDDRRNIPNIMRLNDANGNSVDVVNDILPHCPPTKDLMRINTAFVRYEQDGDCYRSCDSFITRVEGRSYEFVSVCCYDNSGSHIMTGRNAGRLTDLIADSQFKDACCTANNNTNCTLYTSRRPPIPRGEPDVSKCANAWGDPHYTSFDGEKYTFRAQGRYMAMNVSFENGQNFELQAMIRGLVTKSLAFGVRHRYAYQFMERYQPVLYKTFPEEERISSGVDNDDVRITFDERQRQ